jgi:hypothetical protein
LVFSIVYYFQVWVVVLRRVLLSLQHNILFSSAGCLSLEMSFQSSAPHIILVLATVPQRFFSVFSTVYYFWVYVVVPRRVPLGLQHNILFLSAGCLSLEMSFWSSAPYNTSECELFVPRSVSLGLQYRIYHFQAKAVHLPRLSKYAQRW